MTRKILDCIKENKILVGIVLMTLIFIVHICMNAYDSYQFHQEQERKFEHQQQQIQQINQHMDDMQTQMKNVINAVEKQNSIIEKTSGRLIHQHVSEEHVNVSRGARTSPYSFMVRSNSTVTAYELDYVFQGTNLDGLGAAFVRAELNTGVNAMFLASLAIVESGWGTSYLANNRNNLFGFAAYDGREDSAQGFSSKEDCIETVAEFLANNYCDEDGMYYRGGTIAAVNTVYASSDTWKNKVFETIMYIDRKVAEC